MSEYDQPDTLDKLALHSLPQGSYWELVQTLWRSGLPTASSSLDEEAVDNSWYGCAFADVAFFSDGFIREWFFTSKDGSLRKKRPKSLGVQELAAAFGRGQSHGIEEEVVALGVFSPEGRMDTQARAKSTVAPLERAQLRWLLDGRDASRRTNLAAVLKYVRPRGDREAVLRFDWRAQVCSYELRSACAPLNAPSSASMAPAYQRLATHSGALLHSYKERHVPALAVKEAAAVCEALAARLRPTMRRDQVRVCADFKLLGGDRIVLAWVSMPPADAVFPSTDFPSSMPAAPVLPAAPKQAPRPSGGKGGSAAATKTGATGVSSSAGAGGGSPPRTERLHIDPQLLHPQPKRRPQAADQQQNAAALDAGAFSTHPSTARTSRDPPPPCGGGVRRVPGVSLMCSKYFVCKGCGRAELRTLAVQPQRDQQVARSLEVLGSGRPGSGMVGTDVEDVAERVERLARPASARDRTTSESQTMAPPRRASSARRQKPTSDAEATERPTSATIATFTRLASPRLVVHASDGWHQAGMCLDCSKTDLAAAREQMRRDEEHEDELRAALRTKRQQNEQLAAAAAAGAPAPELAPATSTAVREGLPAGPLPALDPRDRVTVDQLVAAQKTPQWLRGYLAPAAAPVPRR